MKKWSNELNSVILRFALLVIFTLSVFACVPISEIIRIYVKENRWSIDYFYQLWYPFDPYKRSIFELCYFFEYFAGIFTAGVILIFDHLMFGWIQQICMHLEHLKQYIEEMNSLHCDKSRQKLTIKNVSKNIPLYSSK